MRPWKTPSSVASTHIHRTPRVPSCGGRTASRRQTKPWSLGMRRTAGIKSLGSWLPRATTTEFSLLPSMCHTDPGVSVPRGGGQRRPTPRPVQDHAWESEEDNGGLWRRQSATSRLPRQLPAEPSAAPQTAPRGHPSSPRAPVGHRVPDTLPPNPSPSGSSGKRIYVEDMVCFQAASAGQQRISRPSHFPALGLLSAASVGPWAGGPCFPPGCRALKALGGDGCLVRHALPDNVALPPQHHLLQGGGNGT